MSDYPDGVFVERDGGGNIVALYRKPQPGKAESAIPENHKDIAAYRTKQAVPATISARQGKAQLFAMGLMTASEAKAGDIPAFLTAMIDKMDDVDGAMLALSWRESKEWNRNDPLFAGSLLTAAASVLKVPATDATVDQFFADAAKL